jgi:hypothetical protein
MKQWVERWRARLSAGDMLKVKYKPRSTDELTSFLDQRTRFAAWNTIHVRILL